MKLLNNYKMFKRSVPLGRKSPRPTKRAGAPSACRPQSRTACRSTPWYTILIWPGLGQGLEIEKTTIRCRLICMFVLASDRFQRDLPESKIN